MLISGKIIPNSPADQCGQLHINDRILAVNGIDLTHMLHTDVVNLIKESGRSITLTIGPPMQHGKFFVISNYMFFPLFLIKMIDLLKIQIHQLVFDHHHHHRWLHLMEIIVH